MTHSAAAPGALALHGSGRLILQRLLPTSDGWRSVVRFRAADAPTVQQAAEMLGGVGAVCWRVVVDDDRQQVLAIHDGRRWQAVAEAAPL